MFEECTGKDVVFMLIGALIVVSPLFYLGFM